MLRIEDIAEAFMFLSVAYYVTHWGELYRLVPELGYLELVVRL